MQSLAWFKLYEFVEKNEKEKAFLSFRLFFHSLHNDSFKNQIQGDLYLAFSEKKLAKEMYLNALELSRQEENLYAEIILGYKLDQID